MGCGCSSASASDAASSASQWAKIGIQKWDDLFEEGNKLASEINGVKNGLRDSRNFIFRKIKVYYLKPPNDNMLEAFKVFCWAISAQNDGQIMSACKPKIMMSEPYLSMSVGKASKEKYQKMMDCFVKWLYAALKGQLLLPDLEKKLKEVIDKGQAAIPSIQTDLDTLSNMSKMQKLKVAALASKGIKGLVDIHLGIPVLKEEAKMAEAVAKDLQKQFENFEAIGKEIDQIGQKAIQEKVLAVSKILLKYHPGQKYTKAEFEEIEKKNSYQKERQKDREDKKKKKEKEQKDKEKKEKEEKK